ncbi:tetratricopeptide repeat protein [Streptomyces sp. BPTC-684]|nr:tetratricopeptide repeat protein [Streptomyces sp. BPTC-684]WHM41341.1 tetratricopeptide repeat protein [Streptomyces sp. BPTC-684]
MSGPEDGGVRALRGEAYRRAGRYEEALADYAAAAEEDPRDAVPVAGRGHVLRALGRYEEAYACLTRAVALDPGQGALHVALAATLLSLSREGEALSALDRALELDPEIGWAYGRRARVCLASGGAALPFLDHCLSLLDGTATGPALAASHRARGNFGPAADAAASLPGESGAFHRAMAASRRGCPPDAWWGDGLVAACARGDWARADELLPDVSWEEAEGLEELGLCGGVNAGELTPRTQRAWTLLQSSPPTPPLP